MNFRVWLEVSERCFKNSEKEKTGLWRVNLMLSGIWETRQGGTWRDLGCNTVVGVHACVYMCGGQRSVLSVFLNDFLCYFLSQVFLWTLDPIGWLGRLTSKSQGCAWLWLPSTWVTNTCCCAWHLCVLRIPTQILRAAHKHFTNWTIYPDHLSWIMQGHSFDSSRPQHPPPDSITWWILEGEGDTNI